MSLNYTSTFSSSLATTQSLLHNFSNHPQTQSNLVLAFGNDFNLDTGLALIESLATEDLSNLVKLEILSSADINNASGAYSAGNNTIYLSTELLDNGDANTITRVFLEEIGHYLDARVNANDAPGDEGAIFASLVLGETLDTNQLALLQAEDDSATVTIDGEIIDIEQMGIVYVNDNATGTNDGSSWANAYRDLQDALAAAVEGDEIWVAEGTYRPTSITQRDISFVLKDGVAVYGGFAGGEASLDFRDVPNNETILSGDIGIIGDISDNSYHVIDASSTTDSAILDGFTIKDGNADNVTSSNDIGGGIYALDSAAIFRNLIVSNNRANNSGGGLASSANQIFNVTFEDNIANNLGGGIYTFGNTSIVDSTFRNNHADRDGGAINTGDANPVIQRASFIGNSAEQNGGAIYNNGGLNLNRSIFLSNTATEQGGAIYNNSTSVSRYSNSVFFENTSKFGGAIYNSFAESLNFNNTFANNQAESGSAVYSAGDTTETLEFDNSIFWNNTGTVDNAPIFNDGIIAVVSDSIVEGGYDGVGIIDTNPQFVDLDTGDLRLKSDSPAINVGINDSVVGEEDFAGLPRIFNNTVDLGAYEYIDRVLSINNAVIDLEDVEEESVDGVFTVTLLDSNGNALENDTPVTVDYSTVDGTAIAGEDYTATSGTLTFAPGETEKTITVSVKNDAIEETNKTFSVNLSNASIEAISDSQGIGTITDNDDPIVDPVIDPLDTKINRFQNEDIPGTYLFAGEAESENIRANFPNFVEEGLAFKVADEPGDNLEPLYRFQSLITPGTYLFAAEAERQSIKENFSESFVEEGLAFYVYGAGSGLATEFTRFQNNDRQGTYLFANPQESESIKNNFPNFVEEGAAFEVGI